MTRVFVMVLFMWILRCLIAAVLCSLSLGRDISDVSFLHPGALFPF